MISFGSFSFEELRASWWPFIFLRLSVLGVDHLFIFQHNAFWEVK